MEQRLSQAPQAAGSRGQAAARLEFLVLDLTEVEDSEISGIKVLHFIVHELAESHGFGVAFVGLQEKVRRRIRRFFEGEEMTFTFANMNEALRFVEKHLFVQFLAAHGGDCAHLQGTARNRDLTSLRALVRRVVGDSCFAPVADDVHSWLHNYTGEYDAEQVLPRLMQALECQQLRRGDDVFVTTAPNRPLINTDLVSRAPLVWVLAGRVDLISSANSWRRNMSQHVPEVAGAGQRQLNQPGSEVLQIAEVEHSTDVACAGPLDSCSHFFGAFQVPPVRARVVSERATVAVLSYAAFAELPIGVQRMLQHYTTKKMYSANAFVNTR